MDSRTAAQGALRATIEFWKTFVSRCIAKRVDTDRFEVLVQQVYAEHPLPPAVIADFFLRPQPSNDNTLDPRIPPYLQVLTRLGYIDTPSVMRALYKYSSSHAQAQQQQQPNDDKNEAAQPPKAQIKRWKSSYWAEEAIFYSLTKAVVEGRAIPDSTIALEVIKIISKYMTLFTAASTAFAADMLGQLHPPQIRDEMESARAGLVALLLRLCENDILVKAVSKPSAKGAQTCTLA